MSAQGHNLNLACSNSLRAIGAAAQHFGASFMAHLFVHGNHTCLGWNKLNERTSDRRIFPLSAGQILKRLQHILRLNRCMQVVEPIVALGRTLRTLTPLELALRRFGYATTWPCLFCLFAVVSYEVSVTCSWRLTDVIGDGLCGFRATAVAMLRLGYRTCEREVRRAAAYYLQWANLNAYNGSIEARRNRVRCVFNGTGRSDELWADNDTHWATSVWLGRPIVVWNNTGITIIDAHGIWQGQLFYGYNHPQIGNIISMLEQMGAVMLAHTGNHFQAIHR
eukprot:TRINITY_DN1724_c0_g1_i1.p1 TRINITY_DN1724_c0_g1~~TRINITY_DN1724_c0_g1_i1.p1  ORF type:complete len:279 (-),score=17.85 TRINITY_DN1724_c0_g1_i1:792-1628(-)